VARLVPGDGYEGMGVANGRTLGWLRSRWFTEPWIRGEREKIRKALLDYCGQDTPALVRLLETLRLVKQS
jgi:hypothetical protein